MIYWLCVGTLAIRVRRRTRKLAGIVPSQPIEQLMWLVWIPLVVAWVALPYMAATRSDPPWALPEFALRLPYLGVRWLAAFVGVLCLGLSIDCWRRMGKNWRMAVVPDQEIELVTSGLYSRVRHPIYALSMLLMLCTVLVVPTPIVAVMAAIHITLMVIKACNEERFLRQLPGNRYLEYEQRTGRFVPRLTARPRGGRFNLFQRMMLRWSELHPYNPVHIVQIREPLDAQRLRERIGEQLQSSGLTGLVIDRHRTFRYEGGRAVVDLTIVEGGDDAGAALSRVIETEFNSSFASTSPLVPFRFRVVDADGSFHLALVYDHFVAGGFSVARLLTAIACSYVGRKMAPMPVDLYPPTYRHLLMRRPLATVRAALAVPRMVASTQRGFRPPCTNADDMTNAFTRFLIDDRQTRALHQAKKAWGVTLNDLLLALMLQAFAPQFPERRGVRRRNELAVASILSMRGDIAAETERAFSPFLAAFRVGHAMPDGIALQSIAEHVRDESARSRRGHLYLKSILVLGASALVWRLLTPRRRGRLYPKHYPTAAGLTTLNVDGIWCGADGTENFEYLRAVPTGPICPIVFAVTTVHEHLQVGVSFRTAVYGRQVVDEIAAEFVRCVDRLSTEIAQ
ncbi:MAG: methyltransferase [Burkholderiaceae bacterium]